MFNSGIFDVVIGLIFIYLLLSLMATAFSEMIESKLKMRAADLEKGIRELLHDPEGTGLVKKLYDHSLVFGLFQGTYDPDKIKKKNGRYQGSNLPSYIPARNFALALMDIVLPAKTTPNAPSKSGASGATGSPSPPASPVSSTGTTPSPLQPLREAIGSIGNPAVEQALMTLVDAAGDDINKARENIEAWFDSAMERVTGWYTRRVKWISFVLGLGMTIALNADTITIGNSLSSNVAMRNSLVAAAQEYVKAGNASTQQPSPNPNLAIEACKKDENSPECKVAKNLNEIQKLSLPIGWDWGNTRTIPPFPSGAWVVKLLGWLLTAIAVSLGAPFWFDTLSKFINIRSAGTPPGEPKKSAPQPT
jgi:hypothetical protein